MINPQHKVIRIPDNKSSINSEELIEGLYMATSDIKTDVEVMKSQLTTVASDIHSIKTDFKEHQSQTRESIEAISNKIDSRESRFYWLVGICFSTLITICIAALKLVGAG
jgi:peptidoglycan hydrolase CwlO-like protein